MVSVVPSASSVSTGSAIVRIRALAGSVRSTTKPAGSLPSTVTKNRLRASASVYCTALRLPWEAVLEPLCCSRSSLSLSTAHRHTSPNTIRKRMKTTKKTTTLFTRLRFLEGFRFAAIGSQTPFHRNREWCRCRDSVFLCRYTPGYANAAQMDCTADSLVWPETPEIPWFQPYSV